MYLSTVRGYKYMSKGRIRWLLFPKTRAHEKSHILYNEKSLFDTLICVPNPHLVAIQALGRQSFMPIINTREAAKWLTIFYPLVPWKLEATHMQTDE